MGAPKLKHKGLFPPEKDPKKSPEEIKRDKEKMKAEVRLFQEKIQKMLKDPKMAQKAAMLLEEMIQKSNKKK